jgi:hypothetical protein
MDLLESLPNELFMDIIELLSLEDMINVYNAYPNKIYYTILDKYLGIYDKKKCKKGISQYLPVCTSCFFEGSDDVNSNLTHEFGENYFLEDSEDEENDEDFYMYNSQYQYEQIKCQHEFMIESYSAILSRQYIELCYDHKVNPHIPPEINKNDCIYHSGYIENLHDELENRVYETYKKYVKHLKLCYICGGFNHEEYDNGCLYQLKKLRKEYIKEIKEEEKRREERRLIEEKNRKEARERFLTVACIECKNNHKSKKCPYNKCGDCCNKCQYHIRAKLIRYGICTYCKDKNGSHKCPRKRCASCCKSCNYHVEYHHNKINKNGKKISKVNNQCDGTM